MVQDLIIAGRTIQLKGLKKEIQAIDNYFYKLIRLQSHKREINGIVGEEERTIDYLSLFGTNPLRDPEGYATKLNELATSLPNPLTLSYIQENAELRLKVKTIIDEHISLEDKRMTHEDIKERNEKIKQADEKRAIATEEREKIINLRGGGIAEIGAGEMFVTIEAYRDDSDMQSDYYSAHHSVSKRYALGIVSSGPRREAIARAYVDSIPELSAIEWNWNVEEYSMGHGTYLQSKAVGNIKDKCYDGREQAAYWYEIEFQKGPAKLQKSRLFLEKITNANSLISSAEGTKATVRRNEEKDGVEIKFSAKPSDEVLSSLKINGFRWSKFSKVWYKKYSDNTLKLANEIAGVKEKELVALPETPEEYWDNNTDACGNCFSDADPGL